MKHWQIFPRSHRYIEGPGFGKLIVDRQMTMTMTVHMTQAVGIEQRTRGVIESQDAISHMEQQCSDMIYFGFLRACPH